MQAMPTPKGRILYSEDDPDSREIMCLLLTREGFEAVCPDRTEDVLRVAKEEKFDAYLLDTWTPGISGVDLCKRIREFDSLTPVIFYSGAAYEADKEAARAAGAQAYITKPAAFDDVVDAIRSAISASQGQTVCQATLH
jgi:DNA-binding response OmpR family regulator